MTVEPALPGLGQSLVMRAGGSTTMWVQQAVTVVPGAWYSAGAALAPGAGAEAGWVRIAWYASPDASGAQMSTADSPVVASAAASTQAFEVVSTGPVQTPPGARSARVRILLRPAVPGATMAVGEVTFHPTAPPPPPTSMPTPTATPAPVAPAAAPAPAATPAPGAEPAPEPVAAAAPSPPARSPARTASIPAGGLPAARAAALAPAQRWVRITELLPNAVQAGIDADYEWVELTNIGASSVSLEGMRLEDNRAALEVEAVVLAPGASLVIAAPLAEVGNAAVVQRVPVIGNGLSNSGDRLALYAADGTLVDALSYGSDETYVSGERISAPRPGHSIARRFASDGTLVEVLHSAAPSPGTAEVLEPGALTPLDESEARPPQPAAATGDTAPPRPPPSVSPEPRPVESSLWIALLLVAGGLLASLATHRTLTIVRDHRAAAAPAREDGAERE